MANRSFSRFLLVSPFAFLLSFAGPPAKADVSHARIVRLSLVQGDVRFLREAKGDPLADNNNSWERAELNLPIRQGYVLATDNGRAEVEFESGAMAFLAENSVLEFYDLSLEDGAHTTRLILRQGSAEFYVNPARGDYFSVTGGDFSVQAEGKTTFRINNFDDGSDVNVSQGRISVLTKDKTTPLEKGQFLAMRAGDPNSMAIDRSPAGDEFDQWVSGRIENVATATTAALQYSNSYGYAAGFGDLYTYGSWFPVAGYGYCWRPYGVGSGWSPFDFGNWYYDPFFGWTFIGSQPWGWLPYHYGGWILQPGFGWMWNPGGGSWGRRPPRWRPVTAVWVRSGGQLGIVPVHPMDTGSRTPLNLAQGVFPVTQRGVLNRVAVTEGQNWKMDKRPPRDAVAGSLASVGAPARFSRVMAAEPAGPRALSTGRGRESGIVYDPVERRFINSNNAPARATEIQTGIERTVTAGGNQTSANPRGMPSPNRVTTNRVGVNETNRARGEAPPAVRTAPPPRVVIAPPPAPGSSPSGRGGWAPSSPSWGGSAPSRSGGGSAPRGGGAPSGGASRPPSSGGRPH